VRGRWLALFLLALAAAGCTGWPDPPPPQLLVRPDWKVGDRWTFRRTPQLGASMMVQHEVIEATPDGYVMRVTRLNQEITRHWTRDLHLRQQTLRGQPLSRFDPPAMYFSWPLDLGKSWTQEFDYQDGRADGHYTNRWQVEKHAEQIDVVAGTFLAIRIDRLDGDGQPLDAYWYVPAARYWVRFLDLVNQVSEELIEFRPASG
jgi:hypothetical protein